MSGLIWDRKFYKENVLKIYDKGAEGYVKLRCEKNTRRHELVCS